MYTGPGRWLKEGEQFDCKKCGSLVWAHQKRFEYTSLRDLSNHLLCRFCGQDHERGCVAVVEAAKAVRA